MPGAATAIVGCALVIGTVVPSPSALGKRVRAACEGRAACPYRSVRVIGAPDPQVLSVVSGLAFDARGDLFAADERSSQIVEFGPDGTLRRRLLRFGTGRGDLAGPSGVATFTDGSLVVADLGWVKHFSGGGRLLDAWRVPGVNAVSVDQRGRVWTTDVRTVRLFSSRGAPAGVWQIGNVRSSPTFPGGIAAGAGRVLVVGFGTRPVSDTFINSKSRAGIYGLRLDGTPAFTPPCPAGNRPPGADVLCGDGPIAAAPDGSFWLGTSSPVLAHIDADGHAIGALPVFNPAPTAADYEGISALAVAPDGRMAVADADDLIRVYAPGQSGPVLTLGQSAPATPASLEDPQAVTVGRDHTIYVFDKSDSTVRQFTAAGRFLREWKTPIDRDPYEAGTLCLGVTRGGEVVAADHQAVFVYSSTGILRHKFRVPGGLDRAAVAGDRLYVLEQTTYTPIPHTLDEAVHGGRMRVYTIGGRLLRRFKIPAPGRFGRNATDMAIGSDGRIYLTDALHIAVPAADGTDRLDVLDADGHLLRRLRMPTPQALALQTDGSLFVATDLSQRYDDTPARARSYITLLTPSLHRAYTFGRTGSRLGEFHNPSSIALDHVGGRTVLLVADSGNHRIERFTLSRAFSPPSPG